MTNIDKEYLGMMDAVFSEEYDGHYYCIMCEPLEVDDAPSWFAEWIKYRDDLPEGMKRWLEDAGVEPGESAPMFTSGGDHRPGPMAFKYKGMAERTAEKIADMYPDLAGKLHVQICEKAPI